MAPPIPVIAASALSQLARDPAVLRGIGRGIEKESLRVRPDGNLSERPHPAGLGSALTHPLITTDFSEAQLELITQVHRSPEACLGQLEDVHRFVYAELGDELLWPASMPCLLGEASEIPIGRYGRSNVGLSKTIYRRGLANRYGALMQTISGIHYNFSLPEAFWPVFASLRGCEDDEAFRTASYFDLIRNFRRHSWLLIYLFGASPAVCKSFLARRQHPLAQFDEGSLYLPHATSLRMGRLGYQSDAQSSLHISYNSLDQYADTMRFALTQPYPEYERIGVRKNGEYQQLNTALIQIENEFYGTIRPKQPVRTGERPLNALLDRGVEYVEVRCMDLNPFLPLGIGDNEVRFLDLFLLFCLISDSPPDSVEESEILRDNQLTVVERGREPDLWLQALNGPTARDEWANVIVEQCAELAPILDDAHATDGFARTVEAQRGKITAPEKTPSANVLQTMRDHKMPFFHFAMDRAVAHRDDFASNPLPPDRIDEFRTLAQESLARQEATEAADSLPFEDYLERYLAI